MLTQSFPARPSSFPEIREFIRRSLVDSPVDPDTVRELRDAVSQALLDAAGTSSDAAIQVSLRLYGDEIEIDILRSATEADVEEAEPDSFARWFVGVLRREGLSQEAAARQIGVSVRTISRWVRGESEPRLRDLRRLHELFGETPVG